MSIQQTLRQFEKVDLLKTSTPLHRLDNLSKRFGREIYIKRDDMTPLAMGGNKLRKLEFLMADALAKNAKIIVTAGAIQSNHVRQTAAVAAMYGLECVALLENPIQSNDTNFLHNGNKLLTDLFGARCVMCDELTDPQAQMEELITSQSLRDAYIVPVGGSNALGALGYIQCAVEIAGQKPENIEFDKVIVASGSAGTHAGLAIGLKELLPRSQVIGVTVSRKQQDQAPKVEKLQNELAQLLALNQVPDVILWDSFFAPMYGMPNQQGLAAIALLAQQEGILLDPVYTGKAMAGLIDYLENSAEKTPVLFVHTGGAQALFAYADISQTI
ncbi:MULTISPECIES: D-cysteine desulfhydrase [Providencia]|uniref:D-cysteine desulfhydrase n=1 Tax=Providencia TaxID=586 RepID=UPI001980B015|nr:MULTISPECIES: D-cysteine desulfhydrase [Providencia]HEC8327249.1 D-cysteine desulfhydrase [Providencia rettgeri]MBN4864970.1 D-cysteine desulfhydrase [Providencia stuartii]MBN4874805.1 D-cysteine desulfhydrase [Providencia stuartii]MBN4878982.1 D-cysteine desulfhydrase [Providencia stuartii]MBN4884005.1 D-cysteine desulfhydrase [Providencia stuartii]